MTDYFDLLHPYMQFVITDGYSRILGQQSIPININYVLGYWQDPKTRAVWGDYQIENVYMTDRVKVFKVNNVHIGILTASFWYWGLNHGRNTVETKEGFWRLAIIPPVLAVRTVFGTPFTQLLTRQ
ncbi:MAG: hypothetical protein JHC29_04000 [Thermoplasmata archaeon]|nr:hypothetical protein [Thermoplasmata archaeon]